LYGSNFRTWNGGRTKNKLIAKFPILTDADFFYEEGVGHDMLRLMESKLNKTRKELREIIAGL